MPALEKIAMLQRIERLSLAVESQVMSVSAVLGMSQDVIWIIRHDECLPAEVRRLLMVHLGVVVEQHGRIESASRAMGKRDGFARLAAQHLYNEVRRIVQSAFNNWTPSRRCPTPGPVGSARQ